MKKTTQKLSKSNLLIEESLKQIFDRLLFKISLYIVHIAPFNICAWAITKVVLDKSKENEGK